MDRCAKCGHLRREHWARKWGVKETCHKETGRVTTPQGAYTGIVPMPTIREYTRCKCRGFIAA